MPVVLCCVYLYACLCTVLGWHTSCHTRVPPEHNVFVGVAIRIHKDGNDLRRDLLRLPCIDGTSALSLLDLVPRMYSIVEQCAVHLTLCCMHILVVPARTAPAMNCC